MRRSDLFAGGLDRDGDLRRCVLFTCRRAARATTFSTHSDRAVGDSCNTTIGACAHGVQRAADSASIGRCDGQPIAYAPFR